MLKIPIQPYGSTNLLPDGRTQTVHVELDDEYGTISVAIDVDPRNLTRTRTNPAAVVEPLLETYDEDRSVTSGTPEADALHLADEVRRLRTMLVSLADEIHFSPEPDDARSIAVALNHYADQAERRG